MTRFMLHIGSSNKRMNFFFLSNVRHLFFVDFILEYSEHDLDSKIDNLHSTDDGEACEESHGSSNCR